MITNVHNNGLLKTGNNIIQLSENLQSQITQLKQIVVSIQASWSGTDAERYIYVLEEEIIHELNKFNEILQNQGEYLMKIPVIYEAFDEYFNNLNKSGEIYGSK